MRKVALVFLLSVFVPSLVLAWLAVRSARDQQLVLERQQSLLYQGVADQLVSQAQTVIRGHQQDFNEQVETFLAVGTPLQIAESFDSRLRLVWPLAEVGFSVALSSNVLSPSLLGGAVAQRFRLENDNFLCSSETVEVYWQSPKGAVRLSSTTPPMLVHQGEKIPVVPVDETLTSKAVFASKSGKLPTVETNAVPTPAIATERMTEFRKLVGDSTEGTLARFQQNELKVMFWYRSARDPNVVFGTQLKLAAFVQDLLQAIKIDPAVAEDIGVALQDDRGGIHLLSDSKTPSNAIAWQRPFVSSEISEALPHWSLLLQLTNPGQLNQLARTTRLTIGLLVAVLVLAIAIGGWLVVADMRWQMLVAQQKTDFVSNVSHELKTPLTSIRMFTELLSEGKVTDADKQRSYLNIIAAETARLTRLINNVLDFSRAERGEMKFNLRAGDLKEVTRATVETFRPALKASGFELRLLLPAQPVEVRMDNDAMAQVIVNLISNAEKYSDAQKEITVELVWLNDHFELRVLDRGMGVPRGCEDKIFEQFYRAHDSLSSGVAGSGLGLTLARRIARAHGGDIQYAAREGGGSCFTLHLPQPNPIA